MENMINRKTHHKKRKISRKTQLIPYEHGVPNPGLHDTHTRGGRLALPSESRTRGGPSGAKHPPSPTLKVVGSSHQRSKKVGDSTKG